MERRGSNIFSINSDYFNHGQFQTVEICEEILEI